MMCKGTTEPPYDLECAVRAPLIAHINPGKPKMWSPCMCVIKILVIFAYFSFDRIN
jgi:hypothetical protein